MASTTVYWRNDLLASSGAAALNRISEGNLADGDKAFVNESGVHMVFHYSASASSSQSTTNHPYIIRPYDFSSSGVWVEQEGPLQALTTVDASGNVIWDSAPYVGTANKQVATQNAGATLTYYVDDSTGNDSTGTGTSSLPWKTIQHAIDNVPRILTETTNILIGPGDYDEELDFAGITGGAMLNIRAVDTDDNDLYANGQATAGGNTSLTDDTKSWETDVFAGGQVWIHDGTGEGQIRTITANTSDTLTISVAWDVNPDATSMYVISNISNLSTSTLATGAFARPGIQLSFYGISFEGYSSYGIRADGTANISLLNCYIDSSTAVRVQYVQYLYMIHNYVSVTGASTTDGVQVLETTSARFRGNYFIDESAGSGVGIYLRRGTYASFYSSVASDGVNRFEDFAKGIVAEGASQYQYDTSSHITFDGCTVDVERANYEIAEINPDRVGTLFVGYNASVGSWWSSVSTSVTTLATYKMEYELVTDNSPLYTGADAVKMLKDIKAKVGTEDKNGFAKVDHDTLPPGVVDIAEGIGYKSPDTGRVTLRPPRYDSEGNPMTPEKLSTFERVPHTKKARNVGNFIQVMAKAITDIDDRLQKIEDK